MTPAFNERAVELPSMANAVDVSVAGEVIAVGYHRGDSIVSLFGLETLEPITALRGNYFQCLDLKLNHTTNELLFLAEQDLGVVHFCRAQIGSDECTVIASYPAEFYPKSIALDSDRNVAVVFGRGLEAWDLSTRTVKHRIDFDHDFVDGVLLSNERLVVHGISPHQLQVYDGNFDSHVLEVPFEQCKDLAVSSDKKTLLVTRPGMKGVFMYDTDSLSRIKETIFNDQTLTANFIFALDDSIVIELGRAGYNGIHLENGAFILGSQFSGSAISSVAVSHGTHDDVLCFCQENTTLRLVHVTS